MGTKKFEASKPSYEGSGKGHLVRVEVARTERRVMLRGVDRNTGAPFFWQKKISDPVYVQWLWNGEAWELKP